jgi:hypothetical protein
VAITSSFSCRSREKGDMTRARFWQGTHTYETYRLSAKVEHIGRHVQVQEQTTHVGPQQLLLQGCSSSALLPCFGF